MSDVDTMRWGDTQSLALKAATGEQSSALSGQILQANWQRPCVWRLLLSVAGSFAAGEAGMTFDVDVLLRIGVGQANQAVPLTTIHWTVGTTTDTTEFFDIPAEAMQLQFRVSNVANAPLNGPDPNDRIAVSAFTAPRAEPGGIVQIRDGMNGSRGVRIPDRDGLARWPAAGFEDGELRYR